MFLNGILAICQILFLPGLIFFALYKPKGGIVYRLSVIVSISMVFNATLILPLVKLSLYTRSLFLILIIIEVIIIVWLNKRFFKVNLNMIGKNIEDYALDQFQIIRNIFQEVSYSSFTKLIRNLIIIAIFIISLSLVYWFFRKIPNNIGTVFYEWDAIVSWNYWAQIWAQNKFPEINHTYPQLLPLNLSITYLLTRSNDVSLFAKAIMPIFATLTVLGIYESGIRQKKYGIIAAVILVYLLYKKFLGAIIADGYADVPVAFFSFIALVPYIENEKFIDNKKEIFLSFVIAAGAALTKQVGLFILFFLLIAWLILSIGRLKLNIWRILTLFGIAVIFIFPWYLPVGVNILNDFNVSGFNQYIEISTIVQGSNSPIIRLGEAFTNLGKYLVLYLFVFPSIFLVNRRFKLLILLFLIPFSVLWGIIASYDERNLSITFVPLAIICGIALENFLEKFFRFFDMISIGKLSSVTLILFLLLPITIYSWRLDDKKIVTRWEEAQNNIFSTEINEQIQALDRSDPTCNRILTNYPVNFLPGMKGEQLNFYFADYSAYLSLVQEPDVCWMLVPNYATDQIKIHIAENIENGIFQLVFSTTNWVPYQLIKIK
jgi:hypothetical protein